jgi:hypothetical protein
MYKDEMGGTRNTYGEDETTYKVLVGKPEKRDHLKTSA